MKKGTNRFRTVMQGEYDVSADPCVVLVTVLGSCVAACLRDPVAGVGGMNHFLLPGSGRADNQALKYGLNSMELLINALIQRGARRERLEAKLFGGARMQVGLPDIGRANGAFAEDFLQQERIRYVGGSLGGNQGRKIRYWPGRGMAKQFLLTPSDVPPELPVTSLDTPSDVTLF